MSFKQRVQDAFTGVGTALKATRMLLNGNAANLNGLTTTDKSSLMAAINELDADIAALAGASGATINDASVASATETYSINKILERIANLKAEILGSAGAAYDTLEELKAYVDSGAAVDLTALANRLRIDINNQGLTGPQRQNGRDNLDVYSRTEIGDPETDFLAAFNAALV